MSPSPLSDLSEAIDAFAAGRTVVIVDDEDRENEGDLVVAGQFATREAINFMIVEGRGLVCLSMDAPLVDRLHLPMMVPDADNSSGYGTGFTVSVEAAREVTTGISASDRAETIRVLTDPASTRADLAMPGHVFPLRARPGGVLERRGQTEASVDLAKLAGLTPTAVICEILRPDGEMMRLPEIVGFAARHGLPVISVEQLAAHRRATDAAGRPMSGAPARATA